MDTLDHKTPKTPKSQIDVNVGELVSITPNPKDWTFTGDKLKDDLNLFITGSFYDCTFKVSNEATNESRLFRCHRVFLASCSDVFNRMLFGTFKESRVDQDYEICITKTLPEVFELAMRFVYGRVADFKNPELAVKVYLFAREWIIPHLMLAVENFLTIITPEDALKILESFVDDENTISTNCLEVIQKSPDKVMSSKTWLEASENVVLTVMQIQSMKMVEPLIFSKLVDWGRAQVKQEEDVRSKINNCLKFIRFGAMSCAAFSNLCCKPIALTAEERYKIFMSITQNDTSLLPEGFSKLRNPRCLAGSYVYNWDSFKSSDCIIETKAPYTLTVAIEPTCYLTGIRLNSLTDVFAKQEVELKCEVFSPDNPHICIVTLTWKGKVKEGASGDVRFPWPVMLRNGITYTIKVSYKQAVSAPTTAYHNKKSFSWSSPLSSISKEMVTVHFVNNTQRIVDIRGLLLAKNM